MVYNSNRNLSKIIGCMVAFWLVMILPVQACTLYSASGSRTMDGGTLLTKVRDWAPTPQYWYKMENEQGYAYYGLFIHENGSGLRAGVNEKGLAVVTATAGTIPKKQRLAIQGVPGGLLKYLLMNYSSIEEIVNADLATWGSPQFLMLADKKEIAYIEIGPDGQFSITKEGDGVLYHTNHFINTTMLWANYKQPAESSVARFDRIGQLLHQKQHFTIEDFIAFSNDRHDGNNNSIWRLGKEDKPNATQSMAAFIVHFTANGEGEVYLKYREHIDDKGKETIIRKSLQELFE